LWYAERSQLFPECAEAVGPACRSLGAGRDGDTFKVKNGWKWDNKTGDYCPFSWLNTPEENESGYEEAKRR